MENVENGPGQSVRCSFLQEDIARDGLHIACTYLARDEQIQDDVAQLDVAKLFTLAVNI